jgi:hypothetical protein
VTPAEAIEAAELIEAESRYRNQVGRLMYEAGRREAEAEMAAQWSRVSAVVRGPDLAEIDERRWGLVAVSTSLTRDRVTIPAAGRNQKPSSNWRPDDIRTTAGGGRPRDRPDGVRGQMGCAGP